MKKTAFKAVGSVKTYLVLAISAAGCASQTVMAGGISPGW